MLKSLHHHSSSHSRNDELRRLTHDDLQQQQQQLGAGVSESECPSLSRWDPLELVRTHSGRAEGQSASPVSVQCERLVCVARSAARIDLAGGWTDTPPICWDLGGAVFNAAVKVDGMRPLRCACRIIDRSVIVLHTLRGLVDAKGVLDRDTVVCETASCFADVADATRPCALLKACVIALGVVQLPRKQSIGEDDELSTLPVQLAERLGGPGTGLEVACCSALPAGSGMGGSSILAATCLRALQALLGAPHDPAALVHSVLLVEQLMRTGGGWQDQVGAIFPSFKVARCLPQLPLSVSVEPLPVPATFTSLVNERLALVYTGQQRLAANTLMQALRRYALSGRTPSGLSSRLAAGAERAAEVMRALSRSLPEADSEDEQEKQERALVCLADILNEYWSLKRTMAPGSEPEFISRLMADLTPLALGQSLAGAGAGGFLLIVLRRDCEFSHLRAVVAEYSKKEAEQGRSLGREELSVHRVEVDEEGINVEWIEEITDSDISQYLSSS